MKLNSLTFGNVADLQNLIANSIQETKTLEYKRDFSFDTPEDRKKVLRTLCGFANTAGGDLLYGVEAVDGVAVAVAGIEVPDEDGFRLRLENAARDGIQPRLKSFSIEFIAVDAGRKVVVLRVEKSYISPHRLSQDGHFYGRNSAGTYSLDIGELRQAFVLSETVIERVRHFWADRILKIQTNSGPIALVNGVKVVFEMMPLAAFSTVPTQRVEFTPAQRAAFVPMGTSASHSQINLDGYFTYAYTSQAESKAYTQVFRNGVVETVVSFEPIPGHAQKPVPSRYLETQLIRLVEIYIETLLAGGVSGPFLFCLAILNVSDSRLLIGSTATDGHASLTQRNVDVLVLPEVLVETEIPDVSKALKPLFDSYWNAYGLEASQNYDSQGNWI